MYSYTYGGSSKQNSTHAFSLHVLVKWWAVTIVYSSMVEDFRKLLAVHSVLYTPYFHTVLTGVSVL